MVVLFANGANFSAAQLDTRPVLLSRQVSAIVFTRLTSRHVQPSPPSPAAQRPPSGSVYQLPVTAFTPHCPPRAPTALKADSFPTASSFPPEH